MSADSSQGVTIHEISGTSFTFQQNMEIMQLSETTLKNGKLIKSRENIVDGTVEEMAVKHKMGIYSFNHFRFLINKILPFKKDVISLMLNEEIIKEQGLEIFIP